MLDTWFSSWLWPFSTLGWPDDTPDLRALLSHHRHGDGLRHHLLLGRAHGRWPGIHFMGMVPFQTVYLHGLVRDEQGRKMSKSLGNVIDPLEVMDQYGTDALRFTLATSSTPGNDMKLVTERIKGNRNFANKIWNAARFVIGQTAEIEPGVPALEALQPQDARRPLDRQPRAAPDRRRDAADGRLPVWRGGPPDLRVLLVGVLRLVYRDRQDPAAATRRSAPARRGILRAVLDRSLRLLHPFMPFVTEEIWQHLYADAPAAERPAPALIVAAWPAGGAAAERQRDAEAQEQMALVQEIITRIRDARKQAEVEPARRVQAILVAGAKAPLLKQQASLIEQLARTEPPRIERKLAAKPEQAMALVASGIEVYLPLAGMLDLGKEIARLEGEMERARGLIERSRRVLENPSFVERARADVVQKERDALAAAEDTLARLEARRKELGA